MGRLGKYLQSKTWFRFYGRSEPVWSHEKIHLELFYLNVKDDDVVVDDNDDDADNNDDDADGNDDDVDDDDDTYEQDNTTYRGYLLSSV